MDGSYAELSTRFPAKDLTQGQFLTEFDRAEPQ